MIYLELFLSFLKVGCFSFGGAYMAIPLIRDEVLAHGWMGDEMVSYMVAVSESTPGPIMVNMATYVGSSQGGVLGAAIATFATVLPAFVIILLIMALMRSVLKNRFVQAALGSMRPCIAGIILAIGLFMIAENCFSWSVVPVDGANKTQLLFGVDITAVIFTACLALIYFGARRLKFLKKGISPILLILIAAVAGVAVYGV